MKLNCNGCPQWSWCLNGNPPDECIEGGKYYKEVKTTCLNCIFFSTYPSLSKATGKLIAKCTHLGEKKDTIKCSKFIEAKL
ncbi:hypothetical protein M0R04_11055 [Candidatus Dojkabacteria bacterium]|nr:hypothetical protein [Candidatus Dojkabacteria bacterium]